MMHKLHDPGMIYERLSDRVADGVMRDILKRNRLRMERSVRKERLFVLVYLVLLVLLVEASLRAYFAVFHEG